MQRPQKSLLTAAVGILLVATWWGCSTDVDLTAEYQSIPVVYGLLEMEADTQWVRINRTWLGDGNQIDAAAIRDSSEYPVDAISVFMEELQPSADDEITGNEEVVRTWELEAIEVANKELNGIFYGPEQTLYAAATAGEDALNEDFWYRLHLVLPNGEEAWSVTKPIQSNGGTFAFPPPNFNGVYPMSFHNGTGFVPNVNMTWNSAPGASRYDGFMRVNFEEEYYADDALNVLDSSVSRSITISFGSESVTDDDGVQELDLAINGERFYTELASRLEVNPRIRRVLGYVEGNESEERAFDFILQVANRDLAVYLDVNEANNSIVQERPLWTNIQGGIGLWGARTTLMVSGVGYSKLTMKYLQESDLTGGLNFCSPSEVSEFYCGN